MEEGTILRWLKSVGDEVKRGDELVEIETDKANMTYEATDEGTLIEILAEEGATLPIGEAIARIGEPSEAGGDGRPARKEPEQREEKQEEPQPQATAERARPAPASNGADDGRVKASPVAPPLTMRTFPSRLSEYAMAAPSGLIARWFGRGPSR